MQTHTHSGIYHQRCLKSFISWWMVDWEPSCIRNSSPGPRSWSQRSCNHSPHTHVTLSALIKAPIKSRGSISAVSEDLTLLWRVWFKHARNLPPPSIFFPLSVIISDLGYIINLGEQLQIFYVNEHPVAQIPGRTHKHKHGDCIKIVNPYIDYKPL